MKRKIMWASQHLEIDTLTGKFKDSSLPEFHSEYDDDPQELEGQEIQNVISTPFGLWRVDDVMNPYKQFKMWMAHTNFTINAKIANTIKSIPGVEVLNILTRYRFVIGVGELFNIRDVRVAIEKALRCIDEETATDINIVDVDTRAEVEKLKKRLAEHNNWAIFIFPNGQIDFATDANGEANYVNKLKIYKHAVDHSTGILIEKNHEQHDYN
jgi:hypothetical protein